VVVGAVGGFALHSTPAQLARELRPWLSFGFLDTGALNGMADARYINAVYWTLAFEWMFYIALPFLALFARGWRALVLVAAVIVFGLPAPIVFSFLFGAAAAFIVHRRLLGDLFGNLLGNRWSSPWLTIAPLAALGAYFLLPAGYGLPQTVLLFGFFLFVVHGASLFGLLRTRSAKVLGTISYSIYLTHCIALFVTVHAVDRLAPMKTLDAPAYWLLAALAAAGCVLLSALTYRYVEYPFLHPQPARKPAPAHAEAVS
jgi:peptidoglycan/LPS O-acetylase OafA/YrhL